MTLFLLLLRVGTCPKGKLRCRKLKNTFKSKKPRRPVPADGDPLLRLPRRDRRRPARGRPARRGRAVPLGLLRPLRHRPGGGGRARRRDSLPRLQHPLTPARNSAPEMFLRQVLTLKFQFTGFNFEVRLNFLHTLSPEENT